MLVNRGSESSYDDIDLSSVSSLETPLDRLGEIRLQLAELEGDNLIAVIQPLSDLNEHQFESVLPVVLSCLQRSAQYEAVVAAVLDVLYLQSHYKSFRENEEIVKPLASVIDNRDYTTKTHSYAARVMAEAGSEASIETLLDRLSVPGISTTIRYGLLEYGQRQSGMRGFFLRRQIDRGLHNFDTSDR